MTQEHGAASHISFVTQNLFGREEPMYLASDAYERRLREDARFRVSMSLPSLRERPGVAPLTRRGSGIRRLW